MELSDDVRTAAGAVRAPEVRPGECLGCYLDRAIRVVGCRDRGLTARWHAAQPERLAGLEPWLASHGGYCDCEVVLNVFDAHGQRWYGDRVLQCDAALARYLADED